jgi:hypothetical protein
MKTTLKITLAASALVLMLIADVPVLFEQLVPEAHAIFGVRRRAARRGVIVGYSMGEASANAAAANQAAASSQQQAAPAAPASPPPAATGKPLPLGTVVSALPAGCTSTPVGGEEYYYCGGNFYRAVFQGNSLVYVTAQPK